MNIYRNWFLASRPWSFTMTAISVSVGAALAAIDGDFSWILYLMTLLGTILLHAATNLINDYYDVKSGVDTQEVSTAQYRPHPLVEGKLKAEHVAFAAYLLYGFSFERFLNLIEEGIIKVDLRIGHYPDGRPHDHGTGFRILPKYRQDCFDTIKRII